MKDYGIQPVTHDGSDDGETPTRELAAVPTRGGPMDLDVQRTAGLKPRNVDKAIAEATVLVSDPAIAATMWYRLKRTNWKTKEETIIEGPSVRLAEIMAYAWRNVARAGNIVEIGERTITAEGICVDLERNNPVRVTVTRSIVGSNGRRYSDELVALHAGIAQAIAMRNAFFQCVPGAHVKKVLDAARAAAKSGDVVALRAQMLKYWRAQNVTDEEVLRFLGRENVEQITIEDVVRLRGTAEAIRDGETTVDAEFRAEWREQKAEAAEKITTTTSAPVEITSTPAGPNTAVVTNPMPSISTTHADVRSTPTDLDIDYAATAKDMLGAKLYARVWTTIKAAATDENGELDGSFVVRVLGAPKTIIEACIADADPIAALRQVAGAAQKKLV